MDIEVLWNGLLIPNYKAPVFTPHLTAEQELQSGEETSSHFLQGGLARNRLRERKSLKTTPKKCHCLLPVQRVHSQESESPHTDQSDGVEDITSVLEKFIPATQQPNKATIHLGECASVYGWRETKIPLCHSQTHTHC